MKKPNLNQLSLFDELNDTKSLNQNIELGIRQLEGLIENDDQSRKQKEESFFDNPIVKQVGRTAASIITRSLLGALGLGGRSSSRTSTRRR